MLGWWIPKAHRFAQNQAHSEVVRLLIEAWGAGMRAKDKSGVSPLQYAR